MSINTNYGLDFDCCVELPETKQIIINVPEIVFDNVQSCWVDTGVIKKFRLEKLTYEKEPSMWRSLNVVLTSITIRGFTKNKSLKHRTETIFYRFIGKEVLKQIPDEYHDIARAEFSNSMDKLQEELTKLTNNGIQIKAQWR